MPSLIDGSSNFELKQINIQNFNIHNLDKFFGKCLIYTDSKARFTWTTLRVTTEKTAAPQNLYYFHTVLQFIIYKIL